jgi:hypothetical protein
VYAIAGAQRCRRQKRDRASAALARPKGMVALMDRVVVAVEPDVGLSPGDAGG